MSTFFLSVVNMSISASWLVLAVLLLRLLLKKAPKWVSVLLWGIVAVRLVLPFSIESVMSLIPNTHPISPEIMMDRTPQIDSGIPVINDVINPIISESFAPQPLASANPLQIWIPVFANLWVLGIVAMLVYTAVSYWRVQWNVRTAVLLRNNIFQSENVVSPFVLGIIKPRVYLPFQMNEQDMAYVIAHENAHIQRRDHWWKSIGFLLLALHWFNPLIWLGYVLLCRDIELACDEKVIKELDVQQKADYSQSLLTCSVNRRTIAACPLAFGEVDVKNRIKSVLNYKKPAFWIIAVAIVVCVAAAVCFLTDPVDSNRTDITIDYGSSKLYSKKDMDDAIKLIIQEFDTWDGCELHSIEYSSDEECNSKNIAWMNQFEAANDAKEPFTQCIMFESDFHSPKEGGGAWNPDYEYTDWEWWLARSDGGKWKLMTWGY